MDEPVAIVYFSGTGNTEAVAEFLAEEMSLEFKVELIKAEDITRGETGFDAEKYEVIGFGYPIHGFNAPTVMYDLVKGLPVSGKKYKFAIFRDGYDIKKVIEDDSIKGDYITPKTLGYYGIFKKYLFRD